MVGGEPVDFFTSVAENLNSAVPRTKLIMQLAVIQRGTYTWNLLVRNLKNLILKILLIQVY